MVNLEVFEMNTLGLFLTTQVFGSQMVKAGRGSIINIGSPMRRFHPIRDFIAYPERSAFLKPPAYGASKAAVVNLTRYLATLSGAARRSSQRALTGRCFGKPG